MVTVVSYSSDKLKIGYLVRQTWKNLFITYSGNLSNLLVIKAFSFSNSQTRYIQEWASSDFYLNTEGLVHSVTAHSVSTNSAPSKLLTWSIWLFSLYIVSCRNSIGRSEGSAFGEGHHHRVIPRIRTNSTTETENNEEIIHLDWGRSHQNPTITDLLVWVMIQVQWQNHFTSKWQIVISVQSLLQGYSSHSPSIPC